MVIYPGDGQRSGCCVAYRRTRARLIAAGVAAAGGLLIAHQPTSLLQLAAAMACQRQICSRPAVPLVADSAWGSPLSSWHRMI
jgi:hypothetical protein